MSLHNLKTTARVTILSMFLLLAVLLGPTPGWHGRGFLTDRAADITGARPLAAPGLVVPSGLTGKGEIVGLADSGLDAGSVSDIHADLQSTPGQMPKVLMLKSWAGREKADDPVGHGTHLAGIIAGTGAASNGQYRGIAPGASIYFQGLLNSGGELAPPEDLTRLFRPAYEAGVRIHVDGWGGGPNAYRDAAVQIDNFVRQYPDFLPIFGAGNSGPVQGSLTTEANSKNALVVGASESVRPAFSPDASDARRQADFSSRGPTGDGRYKPDLLAPGTGIVAPRSRLVEGNFPLNASYNVQSGTSQAAAVTGGAAAVLRQYLKIKGFADPSAALIKAALVNGAWTPPAGPSTAFPGILDLAGTVLALEEKTMHLVDASQGLAAGEEMTFQVEVTTAAAPFKATLAWTDPAPPAGAAAALVNDLDLVVIAPNGRQFFGNDYSGAGKADHSNNVEKVYIKDPPPGTYTVKVRAVTINKSALPGTRQPVQDFAVAFGQLLERGVVAGVPGANQVTLTGGRTITAPPGGIKNCVDGAVAPAGAASILPGSDAYLGPHTLYIVGRRWQATGAQALETSQGDLFLEINSQARTGGYYLNPTGSLAVNNRPGVAADLPPGFSLAATLNPSTQTLWRVLAGYQEKEGILARIDLEKRELWLLGRDAPYTFSSHAAVTFADKLVDAGRADLPYGAAGRAEPGTLVPGMAVRLVLDPATGLVEYIAVKRELALGKVARVDGSSLTLATGATYTLFPGAPVKRDGKPVQMNFIRTGDWVALNLMPGSREIIDLTAYSTVTYGRVLYVSVDRRSLYLMDFANQFRLFELDDGTQVFRWGLPINAATLTPGDWVRLTAVPGQGKAWRVDVATPAGETVKVLAGVDGQKGVLRTADGGSYTLSDRTLVTLNGYRVDAAGLPAWVPVTLTLLESPQGPILAQVAAAGLPGSKPPALAVSVLPQQGGVLLKGTTTASRLYLNFDDGRQEVITLDARGDFQRLLTGGEKSVLLVALDQATSGVVGQKIDLDNTLEEGFWDTRGHWAEEDIKKIAARGLLAGYEDGSFRPDSPLRRVELVAILARLAGWAPGGGETLPFSDAASIPEWARAAVTAARAHGLVAGYEDGSFRPDRPVSRVEAAAFFTRYLEIVSKGTGNGSAADEAAPPSGATAPLPAASPAGQAGSSPLGTSGTPVSSTPAVADIFRDWNEIPTWGREAVARAYTKGLMRGVAPGVFAPLSPLTRAQAAAVLARVK
ncbi:Peptidase S8A, subtilisin-related, clostridia-2 [Moorella glycerini]|uniref:Serine protease AprX n=1 Tax=Neomoorella stamsii TaxID=1266720 RepID=A0A9X7J0N9_9FIRM|nr:MULTISPECIES: S8 family serine peptidase [Moorella]PRR69994.1 Serine protease AprX [Moorella stamsii]CEP68455.1 Peptidase S8A, subtilisin-related, clostridia-2 [Moorella glycerini]